MERNASTDGIPEVMLPVPTGPHPIGMIERRWTDPNRPERFTTDPDDRRSIMVRIWYPSEDAGGVGAMYILDAAEFNDEDYPGVRDLRTNAVEDAAALGGPFPVLLYNHGAGESRFTSSVITEELASHGYVVVSVGHNGLNRTRFLPDGSSVVPDTLMEPVPMEDPLAYRREIGRFYEEIQLPDWLADSRFVLDQLAGLNADGRLAQRLDLERIGALGWSFGGLVSIELSRIDDRIKAAVDHDGTLFASQTLVGTDRPFMFVAATWLVPMPPTDDPELIEANARATTELITRRRERHGAFTSASTNDWFYVTIQGAGHASFGDVVIYKPGWAPEIDPARGHEITNAMTVAFFDRYLSGRSSPLLEDPTGRFPEVSLERRVDP